MVIGINQDAYRVDQANWKLFTGLSSLLPTLNGDGLPSVPFRCAVTLSSVTGHADCAGSITIGSEILTFTAAGKKTTTTFLPALPVISPAGLDCNILVEAMNSGGAPILKETTTAIKCRFMKSQKAFVDAAGAWTLSQAIADTTDSNCSIGDMFRFDGVDYIIGQISCFVGPTGTEIFRRLFLK
jgi:hypothetical protein